MSRKCVPQLAVDERMVALFRIIDPDIESSGKHIDECRQIDPRAVDAAYGSREMQCRFQFHDIRRRELFGEEQRRVKTKRISKFVSRSSDLSSDACGDSFSNNPRLQPHQAGLEAGKFVQQVKGRFTGLSRKTVQQVDELFISRMKGCALRIRQSTVKQCVKHDDKLIFVQVLPRAGLNSRNDSIYRIVTVFI